MNQGQYILNCIPSREQEQDWHLDSVVKSGKIGLEALPPAVDLRREWWPVRDQNESGACVGFAAADGVLRFQAVEAGWIDKEELPSPRFVWMACKETDDFTDYPTTFLETSGTRIKDAMKVLKKYGCVLEKDLPFKGALSFDDIVTFYIKANSLRIATFIALGREPEAWKRWLASGRPILTRLDVDGDWFDTENNKGSFDRYNPSDKRGGHAVSLVGYNKERFIVRNSWGDRWGDNGFAHVSHAYARDAFTEAYGALL